MYVIAMTAYSRTQSSQLKWYFASDKHTWVSSDKYALRFDDIESVSSYWDRNIASLQQDAVTNDLEVIETSIGVYESLYYPTAGMQETYDPVPYKRLSIVAEVIVDLMQLAIGHPEISQQLYSTARKLGVGLNIPPKQHIDAIPTQIFSRGG